MRKHWDEDIAFKSALKLLGEQLYWSNTWTSWAETQILSVFARWNEITYLVISKDLRSLAHYVLISNEQFSALHWHSLFTTYIYCSYFKKNCTERRTIERCMQTIHPVEDNSKYIQRSVQTRDQVSENRKCVCEFCISSIRDQVRIMVLWRNG